MNDLLLTATDCNGDTIRVGDRLGADEGTSRCVATVADIREHCERTCVFIHLPMPIPWINADLSMTLHHTVTIRADQMLDTKWRKVA